MLYIAAAHPHLSVFVPASRWTHGAPAAANTDIQHISATLALRWCDKPQSTQTRGVLRQRNTEVPSCKRAPVSVSSRYKVDAWRASCCQHIHQQTKH
jgi:hypothetical protein